MATVLLFALAGFGCYVSFSAATTYARDREIHVGHYIGLALMMLGAVSAWELGTDAPPMAVVSVRNAAVLLYVAACVGLWTAVLRRRRARVAK